MVHNLHCSGDGREYHKIDKLEFTPQVKPGEHYTIITYTSRKWYAGVYQRISLFEGSNLISDSGSIDLDRDEIIKTIFTGVMPDRDLYLNVSLQSEVFGIRESCEDSRDFIITKSYFTTDIPSIEPDTPPTEDESDVDVDSGTWIPPWANWEAPTVSLLDPDMDKTLMYVLVGIIVIVIAVIISKR